LKGSTTITCPPLTQIKVAFDIISRHFRIIPATGDAGFYRMSWHLKKIADYYDAEGDLSSVIIKEAHRHEDSQGGSN